MNKLRKIFLVIGLILSALSAIPVFADNSEQGVCARVRIQISQDVTLTRTAFRATLEIDNAPENVSLENLSVTIDIEDSSHNAANALFGIQPPQLTGISDVNGSGVLSPGTSGKAEWTIIPTRNAAPDAPLQYYVGGTLSYTQSGTQMNMPLFPATILVKPDPKLVLDYFLVRDVYSDDPFTPDIIEPAEPFPLGLILKNEGKGTAYNVKIVSSQPKIVDNQKGLLIDFKIIGTQLNTEQVSPSLTVNFGEIGPGQTAVAQWMMTASLQGKFIKDQNMATFEHVNDLGIPGLSLIERVNIHQILHSVRVDVPNDDNKPDFLADDVDDPNFLPDTLYNSDGTTAPVNVATNSTINGQLGTGNLQVKLTAAAPNGWIYIRVDDPGQEKFQLKKVVRSDGREIRMEDNAWATHRTIRLTGQDPFRQNFLHIFDFINNNACEYTLIYENIVEKHATPVLEFIPNRSIPEGTHFGFIVKAGNPNGAIPKLSAASLPQGAVFTDKGNGEGLFDWALSQAGRYEITFTASDGSLTASQPVMITINAHTPTDTDADGIPDAWEMKYFGTPDRDGNGDFNKNGISDLDEYLNGTDPTLIPGDINHDQQVDLKDAIIALQILSGLTPSEPIYIKADVNGDGKIGMEEVIYILQVVSGLRNTIIQTDSDADGMPDTWEMKYFGTLDGNGTGDFDGDGISDLDEYLNGTDPTSMPGDINQDKQADLSDAILVLQIMSGITPSGTTNKGADVNGDGKIGLEEVIYILQMVAELRK